MLKYFIAGALFCLTSSTFADNFHNNTSCIKVHSVSVLNSPPLPGLTTEPTSQIVVGGFVVGEHEGINFHLDVNAASTNKNLETVTEALRTNRALCYDQVYLTGMSLLVVDGSYFTLMPLRKQR
jgi:hypothetical protein